MSFTVNLYNFAKRENSTKQPAAGPVSFECILRSPSGIVTPSISLDLGRTQNPAAYNYAYIPAFKRYYFIAEWTYDSPLWTARCVCDVLATYKSAIGSSSLYILRAASASDGSVVDNLYPMKSAPVNSVKTFSTKYQTVDSSLAGGRYIVGVVDSDPTQGSIAYYMMGYPGLRSLMDYLMNSFVTADHGFDITDASIMLQKSIIDPFDYIKSCIWVPFAPTDLPSGAGSSGEIKIAGISTGISATKLSYTYNCIIHQSIAITGIARHPQAADRGSYLNIAPYTEAEIFIPPFGLISLDTRILASSPSITLDLRTDLISGNGILNIEIGGTDVNRIQSQVGVPIQLSQIRQDIIGGATSLVSAGASALLGNYLGSAAGVGSAAQALAPKASTIGGAGGWSDLSGQPGLIQHFYPVTDDDPDHAGRPLMAVRQISSLSGYIICQDGDVPIDGTQSEAESVRSYLEGGFYYE